MSEEIKHINDNDQVRLIDDEPIVTVGHTNSSGEGEEKIEQVTVINVAQRKRWPWIVMGIACLVMAIAGGLLAYKYWIINNYELPISVSPQENIKKLQAAPVKQPADVVMTTDSVLGVELNFYEIKGTRASLETKEPSAWDANVYLYTRCVDLDPDGKAMGSLVMRDSVNVDENSNRKGYFAAVGNQAVIGVTTDEAEIRDYCHDNGGFFFRQFVLLSKGQIPELYLHGKAERRAIARKADNPNLFYVEAPNPETMWDFADALREYGFDDAIYITGGNTTSYYREQDRKGLILIGDKDKKKWLKHKRTNGCWLVFRDAKLSKKKRK